MVRVKAIKVRAAAAKVTTMAQQGVAQEVGANNKEQVAVLQSRWRRAAKQAVAAKRARSGSMQVEEPEHAEHPEKRYRGSSIGSAAAEHVETKHEGEDMPAIEDKETDLEGERSHTMQEVHKRTAKNTKAESSERYSRDESKHGRDVASNSGGSTGGNRGSDFRNEVVWP